MIAPTYLRLVLVAAALLVSGCATVTTGTTQTVAVMTDPEGADCQFSRDNALVARVNPTPGVVTVGKSSGKIAVLCKKDGYQDTAGELASEFQAMTFGNIILGGIIGVVVDAASGAMNKYPESISFTLVPVTFPTVEARDKFFADLKATFLKEYAEVVTRIKALCKQDCEAQLAAAEASKESRLADIEKRRLAATVKAS
jgi:hypothetical protein